MNNMISNKFINSSANGLFVSEARPPNTDDDGDSSEAKVKLKHGAWEVEITCPVNDVRRVVENVLSSLDSSKVAEDQAAILDEIEKLRQDLEAIKARPVAETRPMTAISNDAKDAIAINKGGMTCRGLLQNLWLEGYFEAEKSLGEVHEEMSRRGYNYDRTAVAHSLADMVRENIMSRLGSMRSYRYIQKRPASDIAMSG